MAQGLYEPPAVSTGGPGGNAAPCQRVAGVRRVTVAAQELAKRARPTKASTSASTYRATRDSPC